MRNKTNMSGLSWHRMHALEVPTHASGSFLRKSQSDYASWRSRDFACARKSTWFLCSFDFVALCSSSNPFYTHALLSFFLSIFKNTQASRQIIEKYYSRLTLDFATNKRIADEIAIIPSKRLRNKIAGFRGISLKLQEEERERRMDFIPDESALQTDSIEVDRDTMDMLKSMNMGNLPGVSIGHRGRHRR